jgi:hypothetical protein
VVLSRLAIYKRGSAGRFIDARSDDCLTEHRLTFPRKGEAKSQHVRSVCQENRARMVGETECSPVTGDASNSNSGWDVRYRADRRNIRGSLPGGRAISPAAARSVRKEALALALLLSLRLWSGIWAVVAPLILG